MKALTIWQPWASMAAVGIKHNETRGYPTNYRGGIAIHAGKKSVNEIWSAYLDERARETICRRLNLSSHTGLEIFPLGCVLATANLVECIKITPEFIATLSPDELALGDYTLGRYAWKLADVKQFQAPIPARGQQGLWEWEGMR